MVVRYPIETWSRPQLEDHFHNVAQELQEAKKKMKDQEKQIATFNSRFRRNLLERKHRDEQMIEREKFEDVLKEKQILDMKLKAAKHQLLIYTAPSARATTASAMTGRSTFRQPPSTWRQRQPISGVSIDRSTQPRKSVTEREQLQLGTEEKMMIVRLNRTLKQRNEQITELQYTIEKLKEQLASHRSKNGKHEKTRTPSSRQSTASSKSSGNNTNDLDSEKSDDSLSEMSEMTGSSRSDLDRLEVEPKKSRKAVKKTPTKLEFSEKTVKDKLRIAENDLQLLRTENDVLKNANERLVQQSLSKSTDYGARESLEEKKKNVTLEEQNKELERRIKESEHRRKEDQKKFEEMRIHYKNKSNLIQTAMVQNTPSQPQIVKPDSPPPITYEPLRKRGSHSEMSRMRKADDDILMKLYKDVSDVLSSHDISDVAILDIGDGKQNLAKWQKLYSELYEELEKVRNMLVIQHDINQKQLVEVKILQDEMGRMKTLNTENLKKAKNLIEEKQKKIFMLEEQIRTIAYSGQQPIKLLDSQNNLELSSPNMNTDLSVKIVFVKPAASLTSKFFFSLEFFDFQLETTPTMEPKKQSTSFTTIYDVVVSSLLIHYLQTNGVTIEMYKPLQDQYILLAAATISLIPLFEDNVLQKFCSELTLKSIETGAEMCTIGYEIQVSQPFSDSFRKFKKSEIAKNMLPLQLDVGKENYETERDDNFEPLTIMINRLHGIENVHQRNINTEFCIVYEFLSFSPYPTDFSTSSEIQSKRNVLIPKTETAREMFSTSNISFFLMENIKKQDRVLAMLHIPLEPLCKPGGSIRGIFPMIGIDDVQTGVSLDICLMWKHEKPAFFVKEIPKTKDTPILATYQPNPVKRLSKQFDVIPVLKTAEPVENQEQAESASQPRPTSIVRTTSVQLITSPALSSSSFSSDSSNDVFSPPTKTTPNVFDYELPKHEPIIAETSEIKSDRKNDEKQEYEYEEPDNYEIESVSAKSPTLEIEDPVVHTPSVPIIPETPILPKLEKEPEPEIISKSSEESSTPTTQRSAIIEEDLDLENDAEELLQMKKENEKDEITSLLGILPPIAKPRNLPPIELPSTIPTFSSKGVIFTDPLHRSIPPSDTSSTSSPRRPEKPPVSLPEYDGHSAIKVPKPLSPLDNSDLEKDLVVSVSLEKFEVVDYSRLLMKYYDGVKVIIDWCFLDFDVESSQSSEFYLPRRSEDVVTLNTTKQYILTKRQYKLLDQWINLSNKIDFTLITTDPGEEEELAVAQLTLFRSNSQMNSIHIDFLDVNGEHLAELMLTLQYSPQLSEKLR